MLRLFGIEALRGIDEPIREPSLRLAGDRHDGDDRRRMPDGRRRSCCKPGCLPIAAVCGLPVSAIGNHCLSITAILSEWLS
jgi:hypothetical protein